jgi:dTDP-4-amino-4,6-dideoxygalactose transaminase
MGGQVVSGNQPWGFSPRMVRRISLIPLLDLKAQYETIRDEVRGAMDRVLESQRFILGPEVEALEREVAEYSQCRFGIGMSSGTDALLAALMALDVKSGDEVITTPYSFFATAGSIARLGATPVFADIDAKTFNLDAGQIESKITTRTRAIIPVHLFGQIADIEATLDVAKRHHLPVIEDAAQAIGAERKGRRAGSMGLMGCFSFFPSKNLGGFGDGGMVTTNDPEIAGRLRLLRSHGFKTKYYNEVLGGNFRLDELQAAVLRVKLVYLDRWTEGRQRNARAYRELLANSDRVQLPAEESGSRHIYNQFVIRSPRRDLLQAYLKEKKIGSEVYYPVPLHLQECFKYLHYSIGDFPESELASRESLALPIYPELSPDAIHTVAAAIQEF